MKFLSVAQTAQKWNLSERTVRNYCANGKIPDAFLTGKKWNIPENAERPKKAKKSTPPRGTLHKEGAPGRLLYHSFISSRKRCNPCGYAVFSLLRSVRCCWKASSISSGVSSWRMPTPL